MNIVKNPYKISLMRENQSCLHVATPQICSDINNLVPNKQHRRKVNKIVCSVHFTLDFKKNTSKNLLSEISFKFCTANSNVLRLMANMWQVTVNKQSKV
jgi:hypothetical protein